MCPDQPPQPHSSGSGNPNERAQMYTVVRLEESSNASGRLAADSDATDATDAAYKRDVSQARGNHTAQSARDGKAINAAQESQGCMPNQLPHHFIDDKPVFTAISGERQVCLHGWCHGLM
jgi:hypothetical protein